MTKSEKPTIASEPCPRCGCYVVMDFTCGCGKCRDDYCVNCGRFGALPRDEHTEAAPWDLRCERGAVMHTHSEEAKARRINDWLRAKAEARHGH